MKRYQESLINYKNSIEIIDTNSNVFFILNALIKEFSTKSFYKQTDWTSIIKKRILFLRKKLTTWEQEYYGLHKPTVSDVVYDLSLKELKHLETLNPQFISKNSPTNKVGGALDSKFKKISHSLPMLSLSNTFNEEGLIKFDQTISKLLNNELDKIEYNVEPKIDGLSVSLIYSNGKLLHAVTRGDGKVGEDVTNNIRAMKSIPQTVPNNLKRFEVRGEIFLSKSQFQLINNSIVNPKDRFANPRNAAAGTIRGLDSTLVRERNLDMFAYFLPDYKNLNDLHLHYQSDVIKKLSEYGFSTPKETFVCKNISEVSKKIKYLETNANSLNYPIDGVVIKVDHLNSYDQLGQTSKFPHWATAYKFVPKISTTIIKNITANVGRTGKITYVASLEPTLLSGSTISAATLNNAEYIATKDIRIGDTVEIYKAAEIIPYVDSVVLAKRQTDAVLFKPISLCPVCASNLIKNKGEVDQYCINTSCSARLIQSLIHFCSKNAMNIEGLSVQTITRYFNLGYLTSLSDIYNLNNFRTDIVTNVLNGKFKVFNKIMVAIEGSKSNSLERLIFSLGIKDVGQTSSVVLAKHFETMENFMHASKEEITKLRDIGEVVASSICNWTNNETNIKLIENFKVLKINMLYISKINNDQIDKTSQYYKKNICITGSFDIPRNRIKDLLIEKYDASVTSSLNKSTDYLIVGTNAASKLEKAEKLKIKLVEEEIWK